MSIKQHPKGLTTFGLAMLNVAAVMSLRGLPMMADTGLTMIFYLLFVSVLFLIPCSLVSAELATGWPEEGGIYRWVREAFGSKAGFLAVWLQWIQNVIWYPSTLAFGAGSLAYLFGKPELADSNIYTALVILIVYWGATLITLQGMHVAGMLTTFGVILGTLIPGVLIIGLGVIYFLCGNPLAFMIHPQPLLPDFSHFSNLAFLASIVLLFAGMEVGAVHVHELKDPRKQFGKAVLLATLIIIIIFSLGAFAVAAVLPTNDINLSAGLMQAFAGMLSRYHLSWALPILGLLVAFGALAGVLAWISGPSKALLATARNGEIPPFLAHTNSKNMQSHILIIQGIIVSILAGLYFVMQNVNVAFFVLSAMTISLYLIMYLLMFAAAIRLRYTQPDVHRAYRIPGGNWGIWLVAGIAILAVLFALVVSFFPPEQLAIGTPKLYVSLVLGGLVFFTVIPLIIHAFKKPSWIKKASLGDLS